MRSISGAIAQATRTDQAAMNEARTKVGMGSRNELERPVSTDSKPLNAMAGATGLEPAASGVTGRRSNQLSYAPGKA